MLENKRRCTTIHRYPIFSTRYSVIYKVYSSYCGTSGIEHGLCACKVDNPLAKAQGLSLRTGAQTMLYLSLVLSRPGRPAFSRRKHRAVKSRPSGPVFSLSKYWKAKSRPAYLPVRVYLRNNFSLPVNFR